MRHHLIASAAALLIAGAAAAQPYGMGPGMMGGGMGGYMGGFMGMGPGMMGEYGPGSGMGPGMMWGGYGGDVFAGLDLSAEQREKIAAIREEVARSHWQIMGSMHRQGSHMYGGFGPGSLNEAEARKGFDEMQSSHKAMFELALSARKRIEAVLTPEQREKLRRNWSGR